MWIKRLIPIVFFAAALISSPALSLGGGVTDQVGRKVAVPDSPRRIVSLAPNITEILFAVGAGDTVVGTSLFTNYPPGAEKIPMVGSYIKPNLERIIELAPDLVIATADGEKKAEINRLSSLGIPVYIINPKDLAGVVRTVREIGALVGRRESADAVASAMERRIAVVRERVGGLPKVRALLVLSMNPLVTMSARTFQDELIGAAGGINIAAGESIRYPTLSMEAVIVRAPEVIVMTTMSHDEDYHALTAEWSRFGSIPAVKEGRVFVVDSDIVDRPSPRIVEGLEALARLLHPEAFKDEDGRGASPP
jgi:iron complex transport system substrate-binding protein